MGLSGHEEELEAPRAEPYVPLRVRLRGDRARRIGDPDADFSGEGQEHPRSERHGMLRRSHSDSQLNGHEELALPRDEPYVPLRDRLKKARAHAKPDTDAPGPRPAQRVGVLNRSLSDSRLDELAQPSPEVESSDESGSIPTSARSPISWQKDSGSHGVRKSSLRAFKKKYKSFRVSIAGGLDALKRTMSDPKDEKEPEEVHRDWRNEVNSYTMVAEQLRVEQERDKVRRLRSASTLRRVFSMPLSTTIEQALEADANHSEKEGVAAHSSFKSMRRALSVKLGLKSKTVKPALHQDESESESGEDDSEKDAAASPVRSASPDRMFSSRSPDRKSSIWSLDLYSDSGAQGSSVLASVAALGVAGGRQRRRSMLISSLTSKAAAPTGRGWRARVRAWYTRTKVGRRWARMHPHPHPSPLFPRPVASCRIAPGILAASCPIGILIEAESSQHRR